MLGRIWEFLLGRPAPVLEVVASPAAALVCPQAGCLYLHPHIVVVEKGYDVDAVLRAVNDLPALRQGHDGGASDKLANQPPCCGHGSNHALHPQDPKQQAAAPDADDQEADKADKDGFPHLCPTL